ncbi:MAG: class II aldolase/adducin family protein [Alphaproteobacteria bacterium]|nr:class II aldolase/adducin family protein [Alphaproteobacteria bacterium]
MAWQERVDLSAVLRWSARLGYHEGVCNHMSVMLDRTRFLINPKGMHWEVAKASRLIVINDKGETVEGVGRPATTGYNIHTRVHLKHPNAKVVLHTHMPYATALTAIRGGRLEMCHQNAGRFHDLVAYDDDFNGFAQGTDEGERMAEVMGDKRVLFLGSHGVLVIGDTLADALDDLYYLERTCEVQVLAMSTGKPLAIIPTQLLPGLRDFPQRKKNAELHLDAIKEILDEQQPAYAT